VKEYIDALAGTTLEAQRVGGGEGGVEERRKDGGEEGRRRVEAKRRGGGEEGREMVEAKREERWWRRGRGVSEGEGR